MQFSSAQKAEIFQDGFTVLRSAVPRASVDAALRAINHSLGQNGMHPDELPTLRSQSYCREVTSPPAITDLFNASSLRSLCESVLGEGNAPLQSRGQIALRFPTAFDAAQKISMPHLDGLYTPTNGVAKGEIGNFSVLVGVLLSDVSEPFMGNFSAWPGTHRAYAEYFQKQGSAAFLDGTPKIELPAPRQFTGNAGDAVVCHYQVGHGIAANLSPHIRYAIFFRVKHPEHDAHREEVLADIWRDWPGMADILNKQAA